MIKKEDIHTVADITRIIQHAGQSQKRQIAIQFAKPRWKSHTSEGIPTLNFDQLNVITHHLQAIQNNSTKSWTDTTNWPPITEESINLAIMKGLAIPKLTRRKAKQLKEWTKF